MIIFLLHRHTYLQLVYFHVSRAKEDFLMSKYVIKYLLYRIIVHINYSSLLQLRCKNYIIDALFSTKRKTKLSMYGSFR